MRGDCLRVCGLLALTLGCSSSGTDPSDLQYSESSAERAGSDVARQILQRTRARFVRVSDPTESNRGGQPAARALVRPGVVTDWEELRQERGLRARVPRAPKAALTTLPVRANGVTRVKDADSGLEIGFTLRGASDVAVATEDGIAVYPAAYRLAHLLHRVAVEGTEDFVVFERAPERERLTYDVDVSRVAGLRLVSNCLEFLDTAGVPRLRVAPPAGIDSAGRAVPVSLELEHCQADRSPLPPWTRRVTAPGASQCVVSVSWHGGTYPLIVDPAWTTTGGMSTPRNSPGGVVLGNGLMLVVGGSDGTAYHASAELFDALSGTFAATGSMAAARNGPTVTLLASGKALVAGGYASGSGFLSSAELYDPSTGSFAPTGAMIVGRTGRATRLLSGEVLVTGGYDGQVLLSTAEVYVPSLGVFQPAGQLQIGRDRHSSTLLPSGKVLIAGGLSSVAPVVVENSAEAYDPVTGGFASTGSLNQAREYHVAVALQSGDILVAGGRDGKTDLASAELFNTTVSTFTYTGSMSYAHFGGSISLLPTGKAVVAEGATSEVYDPIARTFSVAGSLVAPRRFHTAGVVSSGKVLLAGGTYTYELSSAELFEQLSIGAVCAGSGECSSGFCVNGVCCNSDCNGDCAVCSTAAGADVDGTCKPLTGPPCVDLDACTVNETCQNGVCVAGGTLTCSPGAECVESTCDTNAGCIKFPTPSGTPCSSGECHEGTCVALDSGVDIDGAASDAGADADADGGSPPNDAGLEAGAGAGGISPDAGSSVDAGSSGTGGGTPADASIDASTDASTGRRLDAGSDGTGLGTEPPDSDASSSSAPLTDGGGCRCWTPGRGRSGSRPSLLALCVAIGAGMARARARRHRRLRPPERSRPN